MFQRFLSTARATGRKWSAAALVGMACAGCATQPPDPGGRLQRLADQYGVCDAAVAVVRQRALRSVETAHGCPARAGAPRDGVFEAASLSKPLFAYAVLKLVEQGKLDLDAPILGYLPDGYAHRRVAHRTDSPVDTALDPKLAAVTVRMALNHTSGLPNWSDEPLAIDGTPGAAWRYSGEGYVLLQRAVEAVTGQSLGAHMRRAVFEPLGMTHSAWTDLPDLVPLRVPALDGDGHVRQPLRFEEPVGAYSLLTTAADYGRFLAALLQDDAMLRRIVAAPVPTGEKPGLDWGLGWGLERQGDDVFLWHWGNNPGYRNFVMVSPRTGDGFVMFTNSENGMALAAPLGALVLPGPHPVYRYHRLRDGLASLLCQRFDFCP